MKPGLAHDLTIACGLGLLAVLIAGWGSIDFAAPLAISDDYVISLFQTKTLLRYGGIYTNPEVAFPEGANYLAFPTPEAVQAFLVWIISRFTGDIFLILHAFEALCFFTAAMSAYLAMRLTRIPPWLAACGALAFACAAHLSARAAIHHHLCFVAVIPWLIRFCFLLPYQRGRLSAPPFRLSALHAAALGIAAASCGLYHAFFSAAFLGLAIVLTIFMGGGYARVKPALWALLCLLAAFILWLLPNYLYIAEHGIQFPERRYFEQTRYAMRLTDVLIPPLPPFLEKYRTYAAAQEKISPEGNYNLLGLWGIAGLAGGFLFCLASLFPARTPRLFGRYMRRGPMVKTAAVFMFAAILFAVPYGLGFIFNMYVSPTLRSQNRVGIFVLFMAVMAAALLLENWRRRPSTRRGAFYAATSILLALTLIPASHTINALQRASSDAWQKKRDSYREVLGLLEARQLNAVAQLPSYYFPEAPSRPEFGNAEHFWPYLLDSSARRRWSFGSMIHQPQWQLLATMTGWPAEKFIPALRCLGYDAVLIEKLAFGPKAQANLAPWTAELGQTQVILRDDDQRTLIDISKTPPGQCEAVLGPRQLPASPTP
ncbi:MAG: hypothetical protein WDO70_03175 [Alphaproteobacteria bacterium]